MNIILDQIPYELHTLVEVIGIENFKEISKLYGGSTIYIPVYRKVILGERNEEIMRMYNGKNIGQIREKYGISEQQIKRVLSKNNKLN